MAERVEDEEALLEAAVRAFGAVLPPRWRVERQQGAGDEGDARLALYDANGSGSSWLVVASLRPTPASLREAVGSPLARRLRHTSHTAVLVVAPYLSPRSRDLLEQEHVNYLDLAGNVFLSADHPAVLVRTVGAQRDPVPRARPDRGVSGPVAGQVIRALVDVAPPYQVAQVAAVAQVSTGYCSRVLQALEDDALIARTRRGFVTEVQWEDLLRRRAQTVRDLFDPARTSGYISRNGVTKTLTDLAAIRLRYAVTGSFAAARLSAVTAPRGLVVYSDDPTGLAAALELIPSDEGADVRIIEPATPGVYQRTVVDDTGLWWVAPSQIVIDCLAGTGRMPDEGDAVLAWMHHHEPEWRIPTIDDVASPDPDGNDAP